MGRSVEVTSSTYANGAVMPSDYSLRLYYTNAEIAEYDSITNNTLNNVQYQVHWINGGNGCNVSNYLGSAITSIPNVPSTIYGSNKGGIYLQCDLNHFTLFIATKLSTPLQLNTLQLNGITLQNKNKLSWEIASKENWNTVYLERINKNKEFESIAVMPYINAKIKYEYEDVKLNSQSNTYRIKVIDANNKVYYSNLVALHNLSINNELAVYPNPAKQTIYIQNAKATTAKISNVLGQTLSYKITIGDNRIDVSNLAPGNYRIVIGQEVLAFVKQ
jgi:hypothetical protein